MQPLWYRNAVIYEIDIPLFRDSNGDGCGDLIGAADRLEHVRELGVDTVWLLPFYRSPFRDGGYDVIDHLVVDPRFGDNADAAHLFDRADELGIRVILDIVPQHTSIDHRWFQEARRDRSSRYRDYYVWSDEPVDTDIEPVFPTEEDSVWEWDEEAQQFYRHAFYRHEPDLELGNPRVREEMYRIMAYWLRMGVGGFRVDAVPYMVERARAADSRSEGLWLLEDMRKFVAMRQPEAILMGEVDVPVDQYDDYLGHDDRFTMLLDFWKNNHTFLALARGEAGPLEDAIREQPDPSGQGSFANFLRNHDELDLEQLEQNEREEVLQVFAPEEQMRAYGRGIRRRLAPMLGGDVRRTAMAHALLMGFPGTPVMLYGDEIGMGDDLSLPERRAVRVPMQWSDAEGAGFSDAPAESLVAPIVTGGAFGHDKVNVDAQAAQADSLMTRVSRLVRGRIGALEIGGRDHRVLDTGSPAVFCQRHDLDGRVMVTAVNLSDERVECRLEDEDLVGLVDVLTDRDYPRPEGTPTTFILDGYGYRWLRRRDQPGR
ncbi:MAG: alpha-amylase family protein [Actinomycetales bacterium]